MPVYICKDCGKIFNHKSHYEYHIKRRKNPCKKQLYECSKCKKRYTRKYTLDRHIRNSCKNNINKCNYCKREFRSKYSLTRHLGKCDIRLDFEKQKEEIFNSLVAELEKQSDRLDILESENNKLKKHIINNVINNVNISNTINNTQNIVNIVAFGKEDLHKLYNENAVKFLRKGYQSIPALVKDTHFDKNKPEYHNVYISNMKELYAITFDGRKWSINYKDDVVDQLFDDNQCFLLDKFNELNNTLDQLTVRKFGRFKNEIDDNIIKNIKNEIKLLLYNNRYIPIKTRKEKEKIDNIK